MTTGATATIFYAVEVTLVACRCDGPVTQLGRTKRYDRAVTMADGYWAVYLGFFGHLTHLVNFSIVDMRDGVLLWRNGRHTTEGKQRASEAEAARGKSPLGD